MTTAASPWRKAPGAFSRRWDCGIRWRSTATPIRQIHISERGGIGFAHLDSRDQGVDALGYVAEARLDRRRAAGEIADSERSRTAVPRPVGADCRLNRKPPAPPSAFFNEDRTVELRAKLLVAADGARSSVREQLGIAALRWEYGQHAVIANITPTLPHENVAYERFTEAGPIALLPMSDHRCAVVCTVNDPDVPAVMALDDAGFLALLHRNASATDWDRSCESAAGKRIRCSC
jgi:2-octaprenyl-6-methoxyphenol hydroxylase